MGKLLLEDLYMSLGNAFHKLRHLPEVKKKYLLSNPLWLLQLWLNAIFKPRLHITISQELLMETQTWYIEGNRLTFATPNDNYNDVVFMRYINCFLKQQCLFQPWLHLWIEFSVQLGLQTNSQVLPLLLLLHRLLFGKPS